MARRALVLGGGGPVGIAWESGIVAGLEQNRVVVGNADLIVGTSAGSVVGAQLSLGRSGKDLLATQLADAPRLGPPGAASAPAPDLGPLMQLMMSRPADGEMPLATRIEIGKLALNAKPILDETSFVNNFGRLINAGTWPEKFVCTTIDALDGSFHSWNRASAVELGRAVASSCAVPGIFPTIEIKGRRYYDGGIRSATNSDLANGYDKVLVVAVMSSAMPESYRQRLEAELAGVRATGARTELIVPNQECLALFGLNLMDSSRRADIAREGERQGRAEASRINDFWN